MTNPWYDMYGNYMTGFDAHMKAWRYWSGRKYEQQSEAYRAMSKRAS